MSAQPAALIRAPGGGPSLAVVGDVYHFLATGADTEGKYAAWEAIVPPGGGPPPHIHTREVESFYILEGEMTFQAGDLRLQATRGMLVHIPTGLPHCFKNESQQTVRMLISVAPAGLEEMFFAVGTPLEATATTAPAPTKAEIEKLLALAPQYGVTILPPPH